MVIVPYFETCTCHLNAILKRDPSRNAQLLKIAKVTLGSKFTGFAFFVEHQSKSFKA
jgi:hypothetical protein